MEFIVSRNRLLKALQHTRCAISKGDVNVFKMFVLTFPDDPKESTMTVNTSDGSMWISETVLLDQPAVEAHPIAVWYCDFIRSVKSLDEQPLKFTVGEYQMTVTHSCGSYRLPLSNTADEFLQIPRPCPDVEAPDGYQLEYEAPGLASILSRCAYAMANDELRPSMNGVYMNLTADYSDYVASDGHKLVRVRKRPVMCGGKVVPLSFILPSPVVRTLRKVLPSTGDVVVEYQEQKTAKKVEHNYAGNGGTKEYTVIERPAMARFIIDDTIFISFKPIDGIYPKYWSVIPEYSVFQMTIDRKKMIKSCDRLSLFQPTSGMMIMSLTDSTLRLNAEDTDFEMAGEEILACECRKTDGTALIPDNRFLRIGMKIPTMSSTLKALSSEKVVFEFIDASRACIIHPVPQPDVEDITMLLMPMLCND